MGRDKRVPPGYRVAHASSVLRSASCWTRNCVRYPMGCVATALRAVRARRTATWLHCRQGCVRYPMGV